MRAAAALACPRAVVDSAGMYETQDEVERVQQLLDESHGRATGHLRSIVTADHRVSARELVGLLTGMKVLSLATVTATGEPRISAVDGHFLHGSWTFSTDGSAAKATHLAARPAVSVAHLDGEDLGVFSHGTAHRLLPGDSRYDPTLDHWTRHYGSNPLSWGDDIRLYRLEMTWLVGYAADRDRLLASRGLRNASGDS